MTPTVTVIVLNHNGLVHLRPCFESLAELAYPSERIELMLVDNASTDGSVEFVRSAWPPVTVVEAKTNLGFAGGNNLGARSARGEKVVFLNNDMRVQPDFVAALVDAMREGDAIAAGAKIVDWQGETIDYAGGICNFAGHAAQVGHGEPVDARGHEDLKPTLFACGGAMIIERDVFLESGGFDDSYFILFEDVDLGWRLWLLGHRVVYAPKALAHHRIHGTMDAIPDYRRLVFYKRNAFASMLKNYSDESLARVFPAALLTFGAGIVEEAGIDVEAFAITQSDALGQAHTRLPSSATAGLVAINRLIEDLPELLQKRRSIQSRRQRPDEEILPLFRPFEPHEPTATSATARVISTALGVNDLFTSAPRRILVLSPDVLPYEGLPTVGSGLRAWGIGQGLASRGHDVVFSMPRVAVDRLGDAVPAEVRRLAWEVGRINEVLELIKPDVIVSCGWGIATNLVQNPFTQVPVVLDQHGPHLLEREFQGNGDAGSSRREKLSGLATADYFTCAGTTQLEYFRPYLVEAGWNEREIVERTAAIRFSLSPVQPERRPTGDLTFVYGGVWLPWQDPTQGLLTLVDELDRRGRGTLWLFGGKHPWIDVGTGVFEELVGRLKESDRVVEEGQLSHAELLDRYATAHVAFDLMKRNRERELAFTSRTVEYLWCGLPVVYNDYSEMSHLIREYDAGWVVDPEDADALGAVLEEIFEDPRAVLAKGVNAQRLVREELSWSHTIEPLDQLVRMGSLRHKPPLNLAPPPPVAAASKLPLGERVRWVYQHHGARGLYEKLVGRAWRALRSARTLLSARRIIG